MLFFRIYHLSAEKYIWVWKKLYAHKAYNYHDCLKRKASFYILDLHFMVKTKEKMAFFDSGGVMWHRG